MCFITTLGHHQLPVTPLTQWSQAMLVTILIVMEAVDVLIVAVVTVSYLDTLGYVLSVVCVV